MIKYVCVICCWQESWKIFSPKIDCGAEVNCEEKYNFFDTDLLFEQRGAQQKQGGAPPHLLSVGKPLKLLTQQCATVCS